ncbi:MAG: hypothetical protein HLX50_00910 [Alteromonadaceae bacterium]|nr:hypothetical protein [Alteromonadaceae bacterium]
MFACTIIHIGAGQGEELPDHLDSGAHRIVLVEPNPELARQLREKTHLHDQITVVEAAVTNNPADDQLTEYNLPEASSLRQPTGLSSLYPGLKAIATHTVAVITPRQLLEQYGPQPGEPARLVIETPGEGHAILQALIDADELKRFTAIKLTENTEPGFEGGMAAPELLRLLTRYGYSILEKSRQDPDWPSWELERNPLQDQVAELEKQLAESQKSLADLKPKYTALQATNALLESQLKEIKQHREGLNHLENRIEQLFGRQDTQLRQTANALGQHVTRSFLNQRQHIQTVASLEHYFETGTQPLEFGGWAIGADLAGHLVRAIEQANYDLIIEFGSGTSTVLLSRVIQNQGMDDGQPKRILSFEQSETYQQKTSAALAREGLDGLVDLVLAPVVSSPVNDSNNPGAPFYDCGTELARAAKLYEGRQARILVLVDGPYSSEGNPVIREPALARLLRYLSPNTLEIVLDDTNRQGEQQVLEAWQQTCQQRGLSHQCRPLGTEKGATWFTVAF